MLSAFPPILAALRCSCTQGVMLGKSTQLSATLLSPNTINAQGWLIWSRPYTLLRSLEDSTLSCCGTVSLLLRRKRHELRNTSAVPAHRLGCDIVQLVIWWNRFGIYKLTHNPYWSHHILCSYSGILTTCFLQSSFNTQFCILWWSNSGKIYSTWGMWSLTIIACAFLALQQNSMIVHNVVFHT